MKKVIIIGSGISGVACAVRCAQQGVHATLVSPFPSERAQSVMAAGGINAVTQDAEPGDGVDSHIEDTLRGGCGIGGKRAVTGLCESAEEIIQYLEKIGTVFSVDASGRPARRAFGGQSHKRTFYCGSSTGKQIVSALVMEARRYEAGGLIDRRLWSCFHSALIRDGVCYGALLFKNLEFIQYHPTTLKTSQKHILISEAARGEGGRLFVRQDGRDRYFMEEKYGPNGNLMTRDIISRVMDTLHGQVYLDISFLDKDVIDSRLPEVRDICAKYGGIDVHREPIPVQPSVHFFMGGLAVHLNHETNIHNLFAVGECASMYHGANRLGGNSLLAAIYSGNTAADEIARRGSGEGSLPDFSREVERERKNFARSQDTASRFPVMYIRDMLAETMQKYLGIVRNEENLKKGLDEIDYYLSIAGRLSYDPSVMPYFNYSLTGILTLARAVASCALSRPESRGAHTRSDYPESDAAYRFATIITYDNGNYSVRLDKEQAYES